MKWVVRILGGLVALLVLAVLGLWVAGMRPGHGRVVTEIAIDRPAPQVFRWLADDERVKKSIGALEELRQMSAPADGSEIGKKFHKDYKDQRVKMEMTATKYEKDRALSILVASAGDPSNGFSETGDYARAEVNGKTRLRFEVQTKYFGFLPRLFEPLITPEAKIKLDDDFRRLKGLAETEPKTN